MTLGGVALGVVGLLSGLRDGDGLGLGEVRCIEGDADVFRVRGGGVDNFALSLGGVVVDVEFSFVSLDLGVRGAPAAEEAAVEVKGE